ncbi:hypothetical protein [Mycolicibacterium brisbanense]|uniref:Gp32 protein n=1 Tax=Mycolicibacterium brisbanense TaxID=146020 RepID=A0A124E169_9MYCO|nr:hypothetical protein [Mycolicibacterium brisbanense]MCV7158040.1 hypothetical protein [Mycolicibacterium brisbanense]GAS92690.1 Gp32 protein [Mycolicibacterium brisbanense]
MSETFEAFRAQAAEYLGFAAGIEINGIFIPHPSALDDDQQQRYNELQLSLEQLDRWPDTRNDEGEVIRIGSPKVPHRDKGGNLVEDYDVRLTKALLGDDGPAKLKAAGGYCSDVTLAWTYLQRKTAERADQDSKSAGSTGDSEALSGSD